MKSPKISTILLSHNRKYLLKKTVESYLKTVSVPFELIIVDNGSDLLFNIDGISNCNYLRIEKQEIGGFPYAFNFGIEKALSLDCQLIHLTNDDVIFNETINDYYNDIVNHEFRDVSVYGPTTNGVHQRGPMEKNQRRKKSPAIKRFPTPAKTSPL